MKISWWIVVYLFFHLLLVSLFFAIQVQNSRDNINYFAKQHLLEKQEFFKTATYLKSEVIKKMIQDYTFWDEMADFTKNKKSAWAKVNLDTLFPSINIQFLWVYETNGNRIYYKSDGNYSDTADLLKLTGITADEMHGYFSTNRYMEIFIHHNQMHYQLFGSTIHPTSDFERKTPPAGYFFVAKKWDGIFIDNLKKNVYASEIEIIDAEFTNAAYDFERSGPQLVVNIPLPGWNFTHFARITFTDNAVIEYGKILFGQLFIVGFLLAASYILFFIILLYRIVFPLRNISGSLKMKNLEPIKNLSRSKSEFGDISRLINEFFVQRQNIEDINTQLQTVEAHQRAMLDNIPYMLWLKDNQGRFIEVNKAFETFFRMTREQVVGKTNTELFSPEIAVKFNNYLEKLYSVKTQLAFEEEFLIDDKNVCLEMFFTVIVSQNGEIIGNTGMARDITLQKNNEAERENLQGQIYQLNKIDTLGKLAGGVAHEFRNYLTVIRGYSDLIQYHPNSDPEIREFLKNIIDAADKSTSITSQLLAFSRKQILTPHNINLNDRLTEMKKVIEPLIGENIRIVLKTKPRLSNIYADMTQIEQIVFNLTLNSRDAMPDGGTILWTTDNIRIDEKYCREYPFALPGNYVLFSVTDDGEGMTAEVLKKIFDPFFTTKDIGKGTGMGLAVVYGIVKQHNGWITAESEPGRGSVFSVYFPVMDGIISDGVHNKDTKNFSQLVGNLEQILLIEDERGVRNMLTEALKRNKYRVIDCGDIKSARIKYAGHHADIQMLISDVLLPDGNGMEFAREIREDNPRIPVILTSGYMTPSLRMDIIEKNGFEFIPKPFTLMEFLRRVSELFHNNP
ncbi:MAG: response regulator [Brevinematales bacterium]|nr:response regulator [Brevinematales bacterium]